MPLFKLRDDFHLLEHSSKIYHISSWFHKCYSESLTQKSKIKRWSKKEQKKVENVFIDYYNNKIKMAVKVCQTHSFLLTNYSKKKLSFKELKVI